MLAAQVLFHDSLLLAIAEGQDLHRHQGFPQDPGHRIGQLVIGTDGYEREGISRPAIHIPLELIADTILYELLQPGTELGITL